jgi:serine/threonine protein kinase
LIWYPAGGVNAPRRIGRYEVLCELGRGGMAELYLARLDGVGGFTKLVAIKRILPHLAADRTFVDQFLNEGRLAARLSHPNVCQVHELGEDDGVLYLVMEYLEGVTWEDLVKALPNEPRARLRIVAGVLGQACDGLQHAHEQPIVHRDVSPTNLFVTVSGSAKVLDFGVSKLLTEGKHTRTGVLKGKLPYMSPEQIEGTGLDHRSDVWAAGVCAWEAMAGCRLFDRTTDFQIWRAIVDEPLPPLGDVDVERVVMKALAKRPDERYATIGAFGDALRDLVQRDVASPAELGALVREQCKDQLAERKQLVTDVMNRFTASATIETPIEDAGATSSLVMRDHSVVLGRPRQRRWWPLAIALAGIAAIAAVIVLTREPQPTAAAQPVAIANVAPDAASDAAIEVVAIDAPPIKKPVVVAKKKAPPAPPPPAEPQAPGTFSIASKPFARIYIDGKYIGETPLFRHRIAAGPHAVKAVLEDGRQKTFQIKVAPEREVNSGTLTW